jgi:selenocysteine-specific elongation factor
MNSQPEKKHLIVGTSGHIDHGKTSLIKAMTGVDADTLEEEKTRGITIELGFIFMETPDPLCEVVFIDVPGHEKLVKTMVAGASNLDAALFVVAADDGINLQTKEHFDILRFLDIPEGVIALTKSDLMDERQLALRKAEIAELVSGSFLESAPVIPVSSVTGRGVQEIKRALFELARNIRQRDDSGIFRMPIDRVFTMQGFGTVVAGTILSGNLRARDAVEVYPDGIVTKVRGIQVHGRKAPHSKVGKRTAVNLLNVPKERLYRGQCLGFPGALTPTTRCDAHFSLLPSTKEVKNLARLRFYTGTAEVLCRMALLDRHRIRPGETAPAQFILEKPVVAVPGDRYVIRTLSPLYTVGGGTIIDTNPVKHKRFDKEMLDGLKKLDGGIDELITHNIYKAETKAQELKTVIKQAGKSDADTEEALARLVDAKTIHSHQDGNTTRFLHAEFHASLMDELVETATAYLRRHPDQVDVPLNEARAELLKHTDAETFRFVLHDAIAARALERQGTTISVCGYRVSLDDRERQSAERIQQMLIQSGYASPLEKKLGQSLNLGETTLKKIIAALILEKKVVRLSDKVTYHRETLEQAKDFVLNFILEKGSITIAELRDALGVSRKYTQAILEYLSETGITKRDGDKHVLP